MTKKYKLNKSELTRLKSEQKIYNQFLPVLKLKQEQLQIEKIRIKKKLLQFQLHFSQKLNNISSNASVLTDKDNYYDLVKLVAIKSIDITYKSIAGVRVPIINKIEFCNHFINFFDAPSWLFVFVEEFKMLIMQYIELNTIKKQHVLINTELKKATRKVNLFEQLLIPETRKAIKKIKITLDDEQVAAVGRAKIAKKKTLNNSI